LRNERLCRDLAAALRLVGLNYFSGDYESWLSIDQDLLSMQLDIPSSILRVFRVLSSLETCTTSPNETLTFFMVCFPVLAAVSALKSTDLTSVEMSLSLLSRWAECV